MTISVLTPHQLWTVADLDEHHAVAVIRYDGDPDVFTALAWAYAIECGLDYSFEQPDPGLYRWNPDPTGEYGGFLAQAHRRGPGVWLGATVHVGRYFEPEWSRDLLARATETSLT